ncbi:hypothetical protein HZS_7948, partial [Henneguya salminicola]
KLFQYTALGVKDNRKENDRNRHLISKNLKITENYANGYELRNFINFFDDDSINNNKPVHQAFIQRYTTIMNITSSDILSYKYKI